MVDVHTKVELALGILEEQKKEAQKRVDTQRAKVDELVQAGADMVELASACAIHETERGFVTGLDFGITLMRKALK